MVDSQQEFLEEFRAEAFEMLDVAETNLLALDGGGAFDPNYNSLFRVFHSLKGAAGMMNLDELRSHMHEMEATLQARKEHKTITSELIDYFLKGVDRSRRLVRGESVAATPTVVEAVPENRSSNLQDLLNRAIDLALYQYSDVDRILRSKGNEDLRLALKNELSELLEQRLKIAEGKN